MKVTIAASSKHLRFFMCVILMSLYSLQYLTVAMTKAPPLGVGMNFLFVSILLLIKVNSMPTFFSSTIISFLDSMHSTKLA